MRLTNRSANALLVVGVLLVFVVTPYALTHAFDYRLVENDATDEDEALAVPYEELSADQRGAVDRAIAGDGPWYRTRADAPIDGSAVIVERNDEYHRLVVESQYHWETRRGKVPVATLVVGAVSGLVGMLSLLWGPDGPYT